MNKYLFLPIFFLFVVIACRNTKQLDNERIIAVTIEPLRYFTEQIAGDKYKVITMVPKGSSPETYDPTPQQLVQVGKSDAYFRIGHIGFERVWMDKIKENNPSMKVFDTSDGIDLLKGTHFHENEQGVSSSHEKTHFGQGKEEIEPHVWNSPANALIIAANIRDALSELDRENAPYYSSRFDSLQQVIQNTDNEVKTFLANADSVFMIYHPALSYFAKDYGLRQISIEEGGKEPSPAHLKELIRESKEKGVNVIFVQKEFDTRNAEIIAGETGTKIISINPLAYDWQEEMIRTAKALSHE